MMHSNHILMHEPWKLHHTKHHQAYTDGLNKALGSLGPEWQNKNEIVEILKDIDSIPESARSAVNFHGGGYNNHSLFWSNMKNGGGGEPDSELGDAIKKTFGGFNEFKDKFSKDQSQYGKRLGLAHIQPEYRWRAVHNHAQPDKSVDKVEDGKSHSPIGS